MSEKDNIFKAYSVQEIAAMLGIGKTKTRELSVSYTHLDVYKRQMEGSGNNRRRNMSRSYSFAIKYPAENERFGIYRCV